MLSMSSIQKDTSDDVRDLMFKISAYTLVGLESAVRAQEQLLADVLVGVGFAIGAQSKIMPKSG